jgi:hypothetical protein
VGTGAATGLMSGGGRGRGAEQSQKTSDYCCRFRRGGYAQGRISPSCVGRVACVRRLRRVCGPVRDEVQWHPGLRGTERRLLPRLDGRTPSSRARRFSASLRPASRERRPLVTCSVGQSRVFVSSGAVHDAKGQYLPCHTTTLPCSARLVAGFFRGNVACAGSAPALFERRSRALHLRQAALWQHNLA